MKSEAEIKKRLKSMEYFLKCCRKEYKPQVKAKIYELKFVLDDEPSTFGSNKTLN